MNHSPERSGAPKEHRRLKQIGKRAKEGAATLIGVAVLLPTVAAGPVNAVMPEGLSQGAAASVSERKVPQKVKYEIPQKTHTEIGQVAKNINELSLGLTDEEFRAWAKKYPMSTFGNFENDFPTPVWSVVKLWDVILNLHDKQYVSLTDNQVSTFSYEPQLGLHMFNRDADLIMMHGILNGLFRVSIGGDQGDKGSALIAVMTQRWRWPNPDGSLETINLPAMGVVDVNVKDSRLSEAQNKFTDVPIMGYTQSKNTMLPAYDVFESKTPQEYQSELDTNVGKAIEWEFLTQTRLKWFEWSNYHDGEEQAHGGDLSLPFNTNPFQEILWHMSEAYLQQDRATFDDAIRQGVEKGIFLPTMINKSGKDVPATNEDFVRIIEAKIQRLQAEGADLETLFADRPDAKGLTPGFPLISIRLHRDIPVGPKHLNNRKGFELNKVKKTARHTS